MENDARTEEKLIKQKKKARRNFLGKIIGGGAAIILGSTILSKKVYAEKTVSVKKIETKKKLMKVSGETPANYGQNLPKPDTSQATGPLKCCFYRANFNTWRMVAVITYSWQHNFF